MQYAPTVRGPLLQVSPSGSGRTHCSNRPAAVLDHPSQTSSGPMATIRDYLDIADAAYQNDPEGHVPNRWRVRKTERATWYGNGFQGSVFESDEEVIVAFSGTKGGPMSAPVSQNSANARIAVLVVPNMAGSAKKLVRWAEQNCGGKPVSIVGHSLGGALAQVVGAWSGRPFVSLNGPGMEAHLKASAFNVFKPRQMARSIRARRKGAPVGLCLNVRGDFVGTYGKGYVGEVRELAPDAARTHARHRRDPGCPASGRSGEAAMDAVGLLAGDPDRQFGPEAGKRPQLRPVHHRNDPPSSHVPARRGSGGPRGCGSAGWHPRSCNPETGPASPAGTPPLAPARSAPPPAEAAEATDLDQDYDRLMADVNGWLGDIGEGQETMSRPRHRPVSTRPLLSPTNGLPSAPG